MTGEPIPDIGTPAVSALPRPIKKRSAAVDFFRGLGLLMVYVDHIVPNFWHVVTLKGVGLSDFAEIFVFLSGYVNAAIYGRVLDSGSMRVVVPALFRKTTGRMLKLYAAHLATMAACFGLVTLFAARGVAVTQPQTGLFLADPPRYALRAILFQYAPFAHSVLPLYIVFVPFLPLIVLGLRRFPALTLLASAAIWLVARIPALRSITNAFARGVAFRSIGVAIHVGSRQRSTDPWCVASHCAATEAAVHKRGGSGHSHRLRSQGNCPCGSSVLDRASLRPPRPRYSTKTTVSHCSLATGSPTSFAFCSWRAHS